VSAFCRTSARLKPVNTFYDRAGYRDWTPKLYDGHFHMPETIRTTPFVNAAHAALMFPTLTPAQMKRIAAHGEVRRVTRGEVLIQAGDPIVPFFVVSTGEIEIVRPSSPGDTLVAIHGAGQFTGEAAMFQGRRALMRAQVSEPGELIQLTREELIHLVQTDATTTFLVNGAPGTFASLAVGQRVHVKGQSTATALMARQIDIQNTNVDIGVNVNGIVAHFIGTATAFQFDVDGRVVHGDTLTTFFGNSAFADLANGVRVEVHGSQRDGFVYATRIHVNH